MSDNVPHARQQTAVNCFPTEVRIAWREYTDSNDYTNRERIPYNKWVQMQEFLEIRDIKPIDAADSNLKYQAL